jgi:hypothetical protein
MSHINISCVECDNYYTNNIKTFLVFMTACGLSIIVTTILNYYKIKLD